MGSCDTSIIKFRGSEPERLLGQEEGKSNPEENNHTLQGVCGSGAGNTVEAQSSEQGVWVRERSPGLGRQDTPRSLGVLENGEGPRLQ